MSSPKTFNVNSIMRLVKMHQNLATINQDFTLMPIELPCLIFKGEGFFAQIIQEHKGNKREIFWMKCTPAPLKVHDD